MGQIKDKKLYPDDIALTENDYLIGTDGDSSTKKTKNYPLGKIAEFIQRQNNTIPSDATWEYCFNDELREYGHFFTPGYDFNGGEDPNISNLTKIKISNKSLENTPTDKYLNLASQAGVMMFFRDKNDFNNYFLVKDPTLSADTEGISLTEINFTDSYWSKSFKKGDAYSINFFFTSDFTPDLYKETNASSTNNPTAPPDGGVHIGKGDGVKVLKDQVIITKDDIRFTSSLFINTENTSEDLGGIRNLRLLSINPATGRVYPLLYKDAQPNWIDDNANSRYHIKNKFPQKEINSNYTIKATDNLHTIFVNNGSGNITISVDPSLENMSRFRQCKFIQKGTGNVTVSITSAGSIVTICYFNGNNKIGGQYGHASLTRQVNVDNEGVETFGEFYFIGSQASESGGSEWDSEDL